MRKTPLKVGFCAHEKGGEICGRRFIGLPQQKFCGPCGRERKLRAVNRSYEIRKKFHKHKKSKKRTPILYYLRLQALPVEKFIEMFDRVMVGQMILANSAEEYHVPEESWNGRVGTLPTSAYISNYIG